MNLAVGGLIILLLQRGVLGWSVKCDDRGVCNVQSTNSTASVYIQPGVMPLVPDKNVVPMKNTTATSEGKWNTKKYSNGYSILGWLPGSYTYECSGGLDECARGCCNMGRCSDPENICKIYTNDIRLIYLIVGFVFLLFFIVYWLLFYVFGQVFNAKPKLDGIYKKSSINKGDAVEQESDKIITPSKFASNEENKNLMPGRGSNSQQNNFEINNKENFLEGENMNPKIGNSYKPLVNDNASNRNFGMDKNKLGEVAVNVKQNRAKKEEEEESKKNFYNMIFN